MRQQRFQLRAESERAIAKQGIVKRLYAEPVAGEEQRFAVAVPKGEGEHAAKALDAILTPLFPGMDDHFGVTLRAEGMAQAR